MPGPVRSSLIALLGLGFVISAQAQEARRPDRPAAEQSEARRPAARPDAARLPGDAVTRHTLALPGRTLRFTATAGTLTAHRPAGRAPGRDRLRGLYPRRRRRRARGPSPSRSTAGPARPRPISISWRIGPWRLPLDGAEISPSAPPALVPNAETWLDFTDLVFIDPPGTGYSRVLGGEEARKSLLLGRGRHRRPRGGRHPLAARRRTACRRRNSSSARAMAASAGRFSPRSCRRTRASACSGLVLVSPVLDFGWLEPARPRALGARERGCRRSPPRAWPSAGRSTRDGPARRRGLRLRRVSRRSPARRAGPGGGRARQRAASRS